MESGIKICDVCGAQAECEHHLIFGVGKRKLADQDKLILNLCNRCHTTGRTLERIHDNPMAEHLSKMLGQAIWERDHMQESLEATREAFRKRYGKSYL